MAQAFFRQVLKYKSMSWDLVLARFAGQLSSRLPGVTFACDMAPNPRVLVWRKRNMIVRDDYVLLINASISTGSSPMLDRAALQVIIRDALVASGAAGATPESVEFSMITGGAQTPDAARLTGDPTQWLGSGFERWDHSRGPGESGYVQPPACTQAPPPPPACGGRGQPCCGADGCAAGLVCTNGVCQPPASTTQPPGGDAMGIVAANWKKIGIGVAVATVVGAGIAIAARSSGDQEKA